MSDYYVPASIEVSGAYASSVSNIDGTLTISPTTGAVIASINLAHANTWTGVQTFTKGIVFSTTINMTLLTVNSTTIVTWSQTASAIAIYAIAQMQVLGGAASAYYVQMQGSGTQTANWVWVLPPTPGTFGWLMQTDGSGTTSWFNLLGTANAFTATQTFDALTSIILGATTLNNGVIQFIGKTSGTLTMQCAVTAGTWTLTLPTSGGTNGYLLQTDGNGISSWFNWLGTTNSFSVTQNFNAAIAAAFGVAGTTAGKIYLYSVSTGLVAITTASMGVSWTLTLPTSGGASGYVLQTDGTGVSSWFNLFGTVNTWTVKQIMANGVSLNFTDTSGHTNPQFTLQADNNFVFYGSNSVGGNISIFSVLMNQASAQNFNFGTGLNGVIPGADNALVLGVAADRWKDLQAVTGTFGGAVTITGVLTLSATPKFGVAGSTGTGTASLSTNCPAATPTAPYTWIAVTVSDGSTCYIPVWK